MFTLELFSVLSLNCLSCTTVYFLYIFLLRGWFYFQTNSLRTLLNLSVRFPHSQTCYTTCRFTLFSGDCRLVLQSLLLLKGLRLRCWHGNACPSILRILCFPCSDECLPLKMFSVLLSSFIPSFELA